MAMYAAVPRSGHGMIGSCVCVVVQLFSLSTVPQPVTASVASGLIDKDSVPSYKLRVLKPFGAEVLGIDFRKRPSDDVIKSLEKEMAQHGYLVFPRHGATEGELVNISENFGGHKVIGRHSVHPEAVHEDVLRLSNIEAHGIYGVGPQWHSDGSIERTVFSHVAFLAESMPLRGGETEFANLAAAHSALPVQLQDEWAHLASVNAYSGAVHPLVHRHPVSGKPVLFLHLGQTGAVVRWPALSASSGDGSRLEHLEGMDPDVGHTLRGRGYHVLNASELTELFHIYDGLLSRPEHRAAYRYAPGDLVILDNLAVAHRAAESAHSVEHGLRILHRTTVHGVSQLDVPMESGLPPFLYIFGENPLCDGGVWQSADYYGVGYRWNLTMAMRN